MDGPIALQNALQEDINEGVVGHAGQDEPQPSTSAAAMSPAQAPSQTKYLEKNSTTDSGKGNSSYDSMVRK